MSTLRHLTSLTLSLPVVFAVAICCGCGSATPDRVDVVPLPGGGDDGGGDDAPDTPSAVVFLGATIAGGDPQSVVTEAGVITMLLEADAPLPAGAEIIDVSGQWLAPAFIDSHVHLAYIGHDAPTLAAGGLAAVVDHAAPVSIFESSHAPLEVRAAGPMVTATDGYPTQSWGANGYGLECADLEAAEQAVEALAALGAGLIKVPVEASGPDLPLDTLKAIAARAHALELPVSAHALGADDAALAAEADADVLAHTPTVALAPETVAAWADRAVITTLGAFGGSATTLANLAALREAGAAVLYGTDLGNTTVPGVDPDELALMGAAGMDGAAILEAGTASPAAWWGFEELGAVAPGKAASLLVLDADPLEDPAILATPAAVYIDGVQVM